MSPSPRRWADLIEVRRLTRFVLVDAPLCFGEDEDRDLVLDGE
jgi:hypothetical protein